MTLTKRILPFAMLLALLPAPDWSRSGHSGGYRSYSGGSYSHHSYGTRTYSSHSHGSYHRSRAARADFQRSHPCPATGRTNGACPGYVVDHVKPLACGGADAPSNMQWQTTAAAKAKDKWERVRCR
jgi:hypothetical protein